MQESITHVAKTLQSSYDEQYSDEMTEWREICGKYKAANILKVCGNHKFDKVLECGAGEGSILKFLDAAGIFQELYAIEISDSGINQIQQRKLTGLKEVRKFNGYEIPYSDSEFDLVYCSHVIEHVEHPRILLREIKRVSKFAVFEIPIDYSIGVDDKLTEFLSYGHINIFTPSTFKFLLKSEGYEIINETLTHADKEVFRFNWYKNMKLKKTLTRELYLEFYPFLKFLRKMKSGSKNFNEMGYSAYTCLVKVVGELKIF